VFKSFITMAFTIVLIVSGPLHGWSLDDIDEHFIDPDISSSKTVFIDVKDTSLVDVLKIISKQSGLSFIADQDVADKKITLYLNKIPLNQALHIILDANDLTYVMQDDSDVFEVITKTKTEKTKITKVYQLKYATVSSSKLNDTLDSGGGGAAGSKGGLEDAVKDALSPEGKILEDSRTNSLIITDIASQFDSIESAIAKLDVPVPQILIEVEMLGVTYGANPISFSGSAKEVGWPFFRNPPSTSSSSSSSDSSSSSSSGSSSGSVETPGSLSAAGLTATLNFLTTNTDARTLARPRILTLNNQTAQIEISTDAAISLQTTSTTTGSSSSTLNAVTPERYTTGVILKVTPQANLLTREVTMAVSPKVIDVILSAVQPPAGSSGGSIYDPETRGSDSMLKLRDGQSMVIGGLMTNQNSKTQTKLPFLGDLPFIGAAFRSSTTNKSERELLIFLTPHIIDDTSQAVAATSDNSSTVEASLDMASGSDRRAQEINSSLNDLELK